MAKKCFWSTVVVALVLAMTLPSFAQETTRGGIAGWVLDSTGAVVPGAKITLIGPVGTLNTTTDNTGSFEFPTLILGMYSVRVEKQGFRVAEVKNIEVSTGKHSPIKVTLSPGAVTEIVEVSAPAITVDTASTAVGANLPDTLYQQVPMGRNVQDIFYIAPGVADGGGSGRANPSISGGSGLENKYIADGVDITDTAFGGLGTFNRVYLSVGTGINLAFVKEVQVKSSDFEPQYGGSTGGIVQIVTKSGSREYHGALTGFFAPQGMEAQRLFSDDSRFNLIGKRLHVAGYDASGEFGGYVPGMREHLFFFGSIDPTWNRNYDQSPPAFGLSALGTMTERVNTFNYAAKVTWRLNERHTLESSIFGDPSHTGFQPQGVLTVDNTTSFAKLNYGSRNWVVRYNGTLSPTWLLNVSFTWMHNHFDQTFDDIYQILDRTQTSGLPGQRGAFTAQGYGYYENTLSENRGFNIDTTKIFHFLGEHSFNIGYKLGKPVYDPFKNRSGDKFPIPAVNMVGADYGGDPSAFGLLTNFAGSLRRETSGVCSLCPLWNVPGRGMVPVYLRQDRGEFGPNNLHTFGTNHAAYVNDTWIMNKHVTLALGLRWEQQFLSGVDTHYTFTDNWSPRVGIIVDPVGNRNTKLYANFARYNYAIPLDMAERSLSSELDFIGARFAPAFTIDASGNRIATINALGGTTLIPDAAHLLNNANTATGTVPGPGVDILVDADGNPISCLNPAGCGTGGVPFISAQGVFSGEGIASGTKMEYVNEFVVGIEQRIWGGVILSGRYVDRRMPRIVEDGWGGPPEAFGASVQQTYLIMNPGPKTDLWTNPPEFKIAPSSIDPITGLPTTALGASSAAAAACTNKNDVIDPVLDTFGTSLGAVCFAPVGVNGQPSGADIPDGLPDGFPQVVRNYQAVEIEANKSFSKNWQMRANWRIAKLYGNFEGAFRNDNGQTDPSISSLFDFVAGQFGLLGGQFTPGYLNTDRRHVVNGYVSYVFDKGPAKGLTLGSGVRFESGIPYNDLKAHPAYLNSGEIPVCSSLAPNCTSPRGSLGRATPDGQIDVHADWVHSITEKSRIRLGMDLFNLTNMKHLLLIDQNEDIGFGTANIDFKNPANSLTRAYQRPFYARFMLKFEF